MDRGAWQVHSMAKSYTTEAKVRERAHTHTHTHTHTHRAISRIKLGNSATLYTL